MTVENIFGFLFIQSHSETGEREIREIKAIMDAAGLGYTFEYDKEPLRTMIRFYPDGLRKVASNLKILLDEYDAAEFQDFPTTISPDF